MSVSVSAPGFDSIDVASLAARRSYKWRAFPPTVLPAFVAEMDFPLARCVTEALHEAVDAGDCGYAWPYELADAFASFARQRHGWEVDTGRVFLVADVMAGVDEVLTLATRPGEGVVVNTPVYPPFFHHIAAVGRRAVEVPLVKAHGRWELDLGALEAAFGAGARAYLLCNPHNPTGRVFTRSELEEIAGLAYRHDVVVLSDEIHADLTLPGAVHTPYVALGDEAARRAVTLTSASKAFNLAGLKCAVVVAGSEQMRRCLAGMPEGAIFRAGLLGVVASIAAWRHGGAWLDELLAYLDGNRSRLAELLDRYLPEVGYEPPEAGYLAWLDCRALSLGDDPSQAFMERGRVALAPGPNFGSPGVGFARLTMGTSRGILEEMVARLATAVDDRPRTTG